MAVKRKKKSKRDFRGFEFSSELRKNFNLVREWKASLAPGLKLPSDKAFSEFLIAKGIEVLKEEMEVNGKT